MAKENLQTYAYRILRYTPNLVRDEWVNIGVVLLDPARRRARARLVEEAGDFARIRRLHPTVDESVLRALQADLERQFAAHAEDPQGFLAKLDDTLSNVLQLSPQRAVMTDDFDTEMERLFRAYVEAPRHPLRPAADASSRNGIRLRIGEIFRSSGIWSKTERGVPVEDFTHRGDSMRLDFAYRKNGTRGFVQAVALSRDPAYAKVLAFTAERIRAKLAHTEFTAVTETEARPENGRHQFMAGVLAEQNVQIVPLEQLTEFASRLKAELQ